MSAQLDVALAQLSAFEVADLCLSPHISVPLLQILTRDPGPAMWLVNRSDVYDATLHVLAAPATSDTADTADTAEIGRRAQTKLRARAASTPQVDAPTPKPSTLPAEAHAAEDLMAQPRVAAAVVLHYARHASEDLRASAALSLTRRLLEHPRDLIDAPTQNLLRDCFAQVLHNDPSPLVRSYAARLPLFTEEILLAAFVDERHPLVEKRLLQSPGTSVALLSLASERAVPGDKDLRRVLALDARLPPALRAELMASAQDELERLIHQYALSA